MQGFFDFMKSLGAARMAAMAAVTLALIGFFSFLMVQMTTPQMVPLFTDLSVEDSASIVKDLERQAVPYQLKSDGAIIMVPKDRVARLRMKLAESGLPKGGGVGYEIFDKTELARHDDLRPEHQSPASTGGRAGPHDPQHRSRAGRTRSSGSPGTSAVFT